MANFHYRLLVIDDEPPSRDLLQNSLSKQGYEVCVAKDGFAALAQMRGALPDLIVSDLKMPNMWRVLCNHLHRLPAFLLYTSREEYSTPSRASHAGVHFLRRAG
jgi:CheY-like chemotaxis protein